MWDHDSLLLLPLTMLSPKAFFLLHVSPLKKPIHNRRSFRLSLCFHLFGLFDRLSTQKLTLSTILLVNVVFGWIPYQYTIEFDLLLISLSPRGVPYFKLILWMVSHRNYCIKLRHTIILWNLSPFLGHHGVQHTELARELVSPRHSLGSLQGTSPVEQFWTWLGAETSIQDNRCYNALSPPKTTFLPKLVGINPNRPSSARPAGHCCQHTAWFFTIAQSFFLVVKIFDCLCSAIKAKRKKRRKEGESRHLDLLEILTLGTKIKSIPNERLVR